SPSSKGGVKAFAAPAHQFVIAIHEDGSVSSAQPSAGDVSGLVPVATTGQISDTTGNLPAARVSGLSTIATSGSASDLTGTLSSAQVPTNTREASIEFVIDGAGSAITTGVKGDLEIPFACTIQSATLLADQTGSIVVDIWKAAFASFPPTAGNSITDSHTP